MFAACLQHRNDAQIRVREQPLARFGSRGSGSPCERAEMLVFCETPQVIEADASQIGNFFFREELLAGLDANHRRLSSRQALA